MADDTSPDWNEINEEYEETRNREAPQSDEERVEPPTYREQLDRMTQEPRRPRERDITEEEAADRAIREDPALRRHMEEHRRRREIEQLRDLQRNAEEVQREAEQVVPPIAPPQFPPTTGQAIGAIGGGLAGEALTTDNTQGAWVTNADALTQPLYTTTGNALQVDSEQIKACVREVLEEFMQERDDFMTWLRMKYTSLEAIPRKKKKRRRRRSAQLAEAGDAIAQMVVPQGQAFAQTTPGVAIQATNDTAGTIRVSVTEEEA